MKPYSQRKLSNKESVGLALVFFALVFLFRLPFLTSEPAAMDEPFTLYWAQKEVAEILELSFKENNPPLHFLFLHYWMEIFGNSHFSWRFPSLLFSACLIFGLVFQTSRKSLFAGLSVGILVLLSNQHIYFSMETRAYSLLAFLTWLAYRIFSHEGVLKYYLLALVAALLFYTHYLSVWIIAAICLGFVIDGSVKRQLKHVASFLLLFGLLILPIILPAIERINHMKSTGTWVQAPVWTQLYGHINLMWNGFAITLLAFATGIYFIFRNKSFSEIQKSAWFMPLVWFLVIYCGLYLQSILFQPVFIPRYLFFASVPLFIFLAMLADAAFAKTRIFSFWLLALLTGLLPNLDLSPSNKRDMRKLAAETEALRTGGVPLIICPSHASLSYHVNAYPDLFFSGADESEMNMRKRIFPVNSYNEIPDSILKLPALVYLDAAAAFTLPENGIEQGLKNNFLLKSQIQIPEIYRVIRVEKNSKSN